MTRAELIERLETAQGADADLLSDAWDVRIGSDPAFRRLACQVVDERGTTNAGVFGRLLDIGTEEAFLGAAMMLVPLGWLTRLVSNSRSDDPQPEYWNCVLRTWLRDTDDNPAFRSVRSSAATPALALAAAAIRAGGK